MYRCIGLTGKHILLYSHPILSLRKRIRGEWLSRLMYCIEDQRIGSQNPADGQPGFGTKLVTRFPVTFVSEANPSQKNESCLWRSNITTKKIAGKTYE